MASDWEDADQEPEQPPHELYTRAAIDRMQEDLARPDYDMAKSLVPVLNASMQKTTKNNNQAEPWAKIYIALQTQHAFVRPVRGRGHPGTETTLQWV